MHFEVETQIAATPDTIWDIITDGPGLTTWDSGIERFEGTIDAGSSVKLWAETAPGRAFKIRVVRFTPPRQMVWKSGMPLGLFTGRRTYTLTPQQGGTHFAMREEFSGPLAGLITKSIPDLNPAFEQYANGLKARAESREQSA